MMLILIGFAPAFFTLDHKQKPADLTNDAKTINWTLGNINSAQLSPDNQIIYTVTRNYIDTLISIVSPITSFDQLSKEDHLKVRKEILFISEKSLEIISKLESSKKLTLQPGQIRVFKETLKKMKTNTEYAPRWVILLISLSLGLGTMIGWKRIVVTIGEKIGKTHLTYAQGTSAELVAAGTIGLSSMFGLPVSTTHVLSSGVAGSMIVGKGKKNLQRKTIRSLLITWVITVPVTIVLAGLLYTFFRLLWT